MCAGNGARGSNAAVSLLGELVAGSRIPDVSSVGVVVHYDPRQKYQVVRAVG
jgi:hypothetical protein